MKKSLLLASAFAAQFIAQSAVADVNVYSYRQEFLLKPLYDAFTKETGIKVNTVYLKKGLAERLEAEGQDTPADIVLTVDISRLKDLSDKSLFAPLSSNAILENVPENLRSNDWAALTTRARAVYSSKDRVGKLSKNFTYLDLANPEWKGKICTRSGKNPYNLSLIASIIAHHGETKAKKWLKGVKANLARKPQGNDRAQVKAIKEGICDISLGNSYYLGKMITNEKKPEQKEWAKAVEINFPNQKTTGTHVNVSGVGLVKHSDNKTEAMKLIDFLVSPTAQNIYAEANFEYPVSEKSTPSNLVSSWGEFTQDSINITDYAKHYKTAAKLVDEVKFDL